MNFSRVLSILYTQRGEKSMKKWLWLLIFLTIPGFSQEDTNNPQADKSKKGISGEYKKVALGMQREEVLKTLQNDPDLEIDMDSDFGDFDEEQKYIVKAKRVPFINYIYYQFTKDISGANGVGQNADKDAPKEWILYAIIIKFNPKYNNYVTLYDKILSKYGEADERTAKYAVWSPSDRELFKAKDGREIKVRLILNHPSTIKIIDDTVYQAKDVNRQRSPDEAVKNYQRQLNDRLLEDFLPQSNEEKQDDSNNP